MGWFAGVGGDRTALSWSACVLVVLGAGTGCGDAAATEYRWVPIVAADSGDAIGWEGDAGALGDGFASPARDGSGGWGAVGDAASQGGTAGHAAGAGGQSGAAGHAATDGAADVVEAGAAECQTKPECDDHNACTLDDCVGGSCLHAQVAVDDGNDCTSDACDPTSGQVTHQQTMLGYGQCGKLDCPAGYFVAVAIDTVPCSPGTCACPGAKGTVYSVCSPICGPNAEQFVHCGAECPPGFAPIGNPSVPACEILPALLCHKV